MRDNNRGKSFNNLPCEREEFILLLNRNIKAGGQAFTLKICTFLKWALHIKKPLRRGKCIQRVNFIKYTNK